MLCKKNMKNMSWNYTKCPILRILWGEASALICPYYEYAISHLSPKWPTWPKTSNQNETFNHSKLIVWNWRINKLKNVDCWCQCRCWCWCWPPCFHVISLQCFPLKKELHFKTMRQGTAEICFKKFWWIRCWPDYHLALIRLWQPSLLAHITNVSGWHIIERNQDLREYYLVVTKERKCIN